MSEQVRVGGHTFDVRVGGPADGPAVLLLRQRSSYMQVFRRPDAEQLLLAEDARRLRAMYTPSGR